MKVSELGKFSTICTLIRDSLSSKSTKITDLGLCKEYSDIIKGHIGYHDSIDLYATCNEYGYFVCAFGNFKFSVRMIDVIVYGKDVTLIMLNTSSGSAINILTTLAASQIVMDNPSYEITMMMYIAARVFKYNEIENESLSNVGMVIHDEVVFCVNYMLSHNLDGIPDTADYYRALNAWHKYAKKEKEEKSNENM